MQSEFIKTFAHIGPQVEARFREEFILPYLASVASLNSQQQNERGQAKRLEIATYLFEAYSALSCCSHSGQSILNSFLPGLYCLRVDFAQLRPDSVAVLDSIIKDLEQKLEQHRQDRFLSSGANLFCSNIDFSFQFTSRRWFQSQPRKHSRTNAQRPDKFSRLDRKINLSFHEEKVKLSVNHQKQDRISWQWEFRSICRFLQFNVILFHFFSFRVSDILLHIWDKKWIKSNEKIQFFSKKILLKILAKNVRKNKYWSIFKVKLLGDEKQKQRTRWEEKWFRSTNFQVRFRKFDKLLTCFDFHQLFGYLNWTNDWLSNESYNPSSHKRASSVNCKNQNKAVSIPFVL